MRRPSRAKRKRALTLKTVKLKSLKDDQIEQGAPHADVTNTERRIDESRRELQRLADEDAAKKATMKSAMRQARKQGKPIDRLKVMMLRSSDLTLWHFQVADALRGLSELSSAGQGAAVSGWAGDGDGSVISDRGLAGNEERGEDHYGAVAVPGVSVGDDMATWKRAPSTADTLERRIEPPRTFRPKAIKSGRRVSDGGMVSLMDRLRKADETWALFMDAAEKAGLDACGRVGCSTACVAVIRGEATKSEAYTRFVRGARHKAYRGIELAMVAGLEAVAAKLGFGR